ncbi:MAG: DNA gyrase inhibitor YacG [Candidatus Dadabacteria bacterium]|nr:DNA gyrase inhibitor YacG [Candidatus Dadabacteria bacterium]
MPVETRCPKCGKLSPWEGNKWRPFCSERCKMVDLGAWVTESYRIPGGSEEDTADDEDARDDEGDQ